MDNPLGIHCIDCSVEEPCHLCADQILAEAAYAAGWVLHADGTLTPR